MVIKIFSWGALITLPVFFVQIGLATLLSKFNFSAVITSLIYWFVIIALTEEIFKYLVVRIKVQNAPEMDEPLDIVLYMIIAALGFAALENILYLFAPIDQLSFSDLINRTLIVSFIRFIGATFLHSLASGLVGYFLVLSFFKTEKRIEYVVYGIIIATVLHGLYNFSIITIEGPLKIIIPVIILISLAYFVISGFEKLKKMKSVCKVECDPNLRMTSELSK
jgi:RsiW-degrading membrane proteinase PrsW (M82 family)